MSMRPPQIAGMGGQQQDNRAPFLSGTRRLSLPGEVFMRDANALPILWQIKESGYLAQVRIRIHGQIGAISGTPITTGVYSLVKQLEFRHNSFDLLHQYSGEGYGFGIRPHLQFYQDPQPSSNPPDQLIKVGPFDFSILATFAYTERNLIGLIALDSKSVRLAGRLQFRADTELVPGGSITWTQQPQAEIQYIIYTAPNPRLYKPPALGTIHKWIEEVDVINSAGPQYYLWPDGNLTLGMYHLVGIADTNTGGKDAWTSIQVLINRRQRHMEYTPRSLNDENDMARQTVRRLGVIPIDLAAYSGMANMVGAREAIDQDTVNRVESLINYSQAVTALHIRRVFARVEQVTVPA